MKNYIVAVMIAFAGLSLAVPDAEARRLGGGGSFGKQSQSFNRPAPAQQNQATNTSQARSPTAPGTQAASSPWRNVLGGALLGLGLGALLSQFGIGGALASMISTILMLGLLALAAVFIYRMLRGKGEPAGTRPAYAGNHYSRTQTPVIGSRVEPSVAPAAFHPLDAMPGSQNDVAPASIPSDFDVPAFLRNAKTYFLRLQAAWDRADIDDIRDFTSPEMFAELRMQLHERGASPNHTDVVSLDAEVLGVETVGNDYLVGVRFSGLIKEAEDMPPEPFTEIWNLSKPVSGKGGWVLAGIQQLS